MNHDVDTNKLHTDAGYRDVIRRLANRGDADARAALRSYRYATASLSRGTRQLQDPDRKPQHHAADGMEAAARRFGKPLPTGPTNADPAGSGEPAGQPHTPAPTDQGSVEQLVTAAFHSVGAGRFTPDQLTSLAHDADHTRYLDDHGQVDVDRIASKLDRLVPRGRADLGQGGGAFRGPLPNQSGREQGAAAAAARFGSRAARPRAGALGGRATAEHASRSRTRDPRDL